MFSAVLPGIISDCVFGSSEISAWIWIRIKVQKKRSSGCLSSTSEVKHLWHKTLRTGGTGEGNFRITTQTLSSVWVEVWSCFCPVRFHASSHSWIISGETTKRRSENTEFTTRLIFSVGIFSEWRSTSFVWPQFGLRNYATVSGKNVQKAHPFSFLEEVKRVFVLTFSPCR